MKRMKCALDLDGVCTDFVKGACLAHNRPNPFAGGVGSWDMAAHWKMTDEEFWRPLNSHEFWSSLEWTADGKDILEIVERAFGKGNIVLLSRPCDSPESASGKLEWIQREMPDYAQRYLLGPSKEFCAHDNAVLIDDNDKNVDTWMAHGGIGVLVPRPWNRDHARPMLSSLTDRIEVVISADKQKSKASVSETITAEAERLVMGARGDAYDHPFNDYQRTGMIWGALFHEWAKKAAASSVPIAIPPELACLGMIGVKLSRESFKHKRDNLTDTAGYALCVDLIQQKKATEPKK